MNRSSIINNLVPKRRVAAAWIAVILMASSTLAHAFNAGQASNSCAGCHGNANPGLTVRATAAGAVGNAITLNQGGTLGMVLSIASGATAAQTTAGFSAAIYGAAGGNLITVLSGSTPGAQILGGAYLTHQSRGNPGPLTRSFSVTIPAALPPGSYTVKSLMLAANGDGGPGGDQWNTGSDEIALTVRAAAGAPGAPTIGTATAGNEQISVAFTPASGGTPATSYQATCGAWSGTGAVSPVVVPVSNGQAVICSVTASNNSGTSTASAASNSVTANNNPGAPTNVSATAGNRQVDVSFTAPVITAGGSAIRGYAATCGTQQAFSTAPTTRITVGNLANGAPVNCTVTATNIVNATSSPSAPSNSVTPAGPPDAPTGVDISTVGNAQLSLAFTAPGSNGGVLITGYTATCVNLTTNTAAQPASGASSPLTVTGLSNDGNYGCFVTATNAVGTGAQSSQVFGSPRAPTPPGAPTGVTAPPGNSQVSVAFTAPANTGGASITGYTATCVGLAPTTGTQSASGAASPLTVTGLTNGLGYRCTVTATNAAGPGAASSPAFVTPSGPTTAPPGAPIIGTAIAGVAQVDVAFSAPGNIGSTAITGYTATCGSQTASGTVSPLTVTGLASTPISCSVTATNSAGTGPASAASNSVTPVAPVAAPSRPGAPTIGIATAGNAQVSVAFTAPSNIGGTPITGYTATCGSQTASGTVSPLTVTGLASTPISCSVTATNSAGTGPASAASNSVTPVAPVAAPSRPGAPTIGTATAGNAQVSVTFTSPDNIGSATIIDYLMPCYTAAGALAGVPVTGPASPLTMTGLANGTAYHCRVSARNSVGVGQVSADSNSVTPAAPAVAPSRPGAPTIGTATPGNAQVSVAFTAPSNDGGAAITFYLMPCYTAAGALAGAPVTGPASPLTMTGLANGTAYRCRVSARNSVGVGQVSADSNSVTPAAPVAPVSPPGVPTNVSAKAGKGGAIVTFSAPSNADDAKLTYRAICGTAASGGVAGANVAEGRDSPLTVSGLNRGTVYICKVAARNTAGLGMDSKESKGVKPD